MRPRPKGARRGALVVGLVLVSGLIASAAVYAFAASSGGESDAPSAGGGPAYAAGVEVAAPWANHGHVALNTPVSHQYVLRNSSAQIVTLGEATIEVLEGC